jgi:hypothetical protein
MQFHKISRPVGVVPDAEYVIDDGPELGTCPIDVRRALVEILRPRTSTPDRCWFCIWDGRGGVDIPRNEGQVHHPGRDYALYEGPIETALTPLDDVWTELSANLWWPDDRAWIVATEVDYGWTYVGGSRAAVGELVASWNLEALPIELTDEHFYGSDSRTEALDTWRAESVEQSAPHSDRVTFAHDDRRALGDVEVRCTEPPTFRWGARCDGFPRRTSADD